MPRSLLLLPLLLSGAPRAEEPQSAHPAPLESLAEGRFHVLTPGLELAHFASPVPSPVGEGRITVLRVDAQRFSVELLTKAREHPDRSLTGPEWVDEHHLVAVINAGMFAMDHSTATFAMTDEGLVNNPTLAQKAGSALLLEPAAGVKASSARLIDLRCEDLEPQRSLYTSLVQSYRLLGCDGTPTWQPSQKIWSHALVGADREGRILFIHARSPWSTRDFTEILLQLPLELERLHYAEGGPEATLALRVGERRLLQVGSWETGFNENDHNHQAWKIPNVIGVRAP